MQYGQHFIPVRTRTTIPESDEAALKKLTGEEYVTKRYQELRFIGASIDDAWNEIWSMLELTSEDIEHILIVYVGLMEKDTERLPQAWAHTYEKIRSFHYDAYPEASTYILTKSVEEK